MGEREEAVVTPLSECRFRRSTGGHEDWKKGDYTRVTFQPDLRKFGLRSLGEDDILSLLHRRVYDLAACNENIKVFLNGHRIRMPFKRYVQLFLPSADHQVLSHDDANDDDVDASTELHPGDDEVSARDGLLFAQVNKRWQIAIGLSPIDNGQFSQVQCFVV
jgi:DNA topoisomerase II